MHYSRRLFGGAAATLALLSTTLAPAHADELTNTSTVEAEPVMVVKDARDDFTDLIGEKVNLTRAERGLDVLRVRQRIIGKRLIVVSKHRDLNRRNTGLDPDRLAPGESFSLFAAYLEPRPHSLDRGYTASFSRSGQVVLASHQNQGLPVDCPVAAERSRIDLERDRVRYVLPLACIDGIRSTRTTAQVIRYKVIRRDKRGMETLNLRAIDQNDTPAPRLRLRPAE